MKSVAKIVFAFFVLIAIWFSGEFYGASKCRPKENAKTLPEFLQSMPLATKFCLLQVSNTQFLEVRTRRPGWGMSSGPPAYIFNKSGDLIDWTSDRGDAPEYQKRWPFTAIQTNIMVEQALAWIDLKK